MTASYFSPISTNPCNDGGSNSRTVLGVLDLNRVVFHVDTLPSKHITQTLGSSLWEVWILEEDRSVGSNVGNLVVHLLADSRNTTDRQSGGSGTDELRKLSSKQSLLESGVDKQLGRELVGGHAQVGGVIGLDDRQERGVEEVWSLQVLDLLAALSVALEDKSFLVGLQHDESDELSQVVTGGHLLESLLAWSWRLVIDLDVEFGSWKNFVGVVERSILTVDQHWRVWSDVGFQFALEFWNVLDAVVVRTVDTCSKDAAHLGEFVGVSRCNQSSTGVVDQGVNFNWKAFFLHLLHQQRHNVVALDIWNVETFGPSLQNTLGDTVLGSWVREGESQREQFAGWNAFRMLLLEEVLETFGDETKQLFSVLCGSHLCWDVIFRLFGGELVVSKEMDKNDTQVSSAQVDGQIVTGFGPIWVVQNPSSVHRNTSWISTVGITSVELGNEVLDDFVQGLGRHPELILVDFDLLGQVGRKRF
ncbi:hypothetical protein OGAPHI_005710 [Ogataea philodendri]|uniref:Uncharacterized protein n=1 Tax=Ogataea philodendri TaxID=1378263 RepID=A0A9P8NYW6_9ASCO|nr:uncharacterized protein OGAPHI_005710 [Ogataea philodendri]KAH3662458.1 hypothetical protein OGAPHI_005710 [Ogataea philodendri]